MGTFEEIGISYSAVSSLLSLFIAGGLIVVALMILFHVLKSAAVCEMLTVLNYETPWLSFVPILGGYAFGSLAGVYRGRVKKENKSLSFTLGILDALYIAFIIMLMIFLLFGFLKLIFEADVALASGKELTADSFSIFSKLVFPFVLFLVVAVLRKIFYTVAVYRIFSIFSYNYAVFYTVLSFILPFLMPILLFSVRNNNPCVDRDDIDGGLSGFEIE